MLIIFGHSYLLIFEDSKKRREWNFPQQRNIFFFSFPVCLRGEAKQTETMSSRSPKKLFKFRLKVVVIWLNALCGFNDGGSWSAFAWLLHRSICFMPSRASGRERKQLLVLRQRMSFKSFSLTWGRYWPWKSCWNTTRHHRSSSFKLFLWHLS